jgi:hypothetical protein
MTSWRMIAAVIAAMSTPMLFAPIAVADFPPWVVAPLDTPAPVIPAVPGGVFGLKPGVDTGTVSGGGPVDAMGQGFVGGSCGEWQHFIFGWDVNGQPMACVTFDGWSGTWIPAAPLYGLQFIGTPCPVMGGGAAQSLDGIGLVCTPYGWQPGP